MLLDNYKKESPIIGVAGMGGGINSYIFLSGGADPYIISRSLRFNPGDTAFLNRGFSAGNRRTYTLSFWIKLNQTDAENTIFGHMVAGYQTQTQIRISGTGLLEFGQFTGSWNFQKITTRRLRDLSAWYHIVFEVDTTLSTAEDRIKFYINGERETSFGTNVNPSQNLETLVNSEVEHGIGRVTPVQQAAGGSYYLADVHFVDGQALSPTDFGEFDTSGVWQPKKFQGSSINDGSTYISSATLNSGLRGGGAGDSAMFDGVIPSSYSSGGNFGGIRVDSSTTSSSLTINLSKSVSGTVTIFPYFATSATPCSITFSNGNTVNMSGSVLNFTAVNLGNQTSFNSFTLNQSFSSGGGANFGIGGIAIDGELLISNYDNSTGYGTNGFNLPFTDNSSSVALGLDYSQGTPGTNHKGMDIVTYTGNGGTQSIGGLAFQPDFVWLKDRTSAYSHNISDSVRGPNKSLFSNATNAETVGSSTPFLSSFNSDGFTIGGNGDINASGKNYVAWCWKAGGAAVSNTDGSITSQVSANNTYGFSVVKYSGTTSATDSFGHGLNSAPKLVIIKALNKTDPWPVYTESVGAGKYLQLNDNAAEVISTNDYPSVPTSSVVNLGGNSRVNGNSYNYIAYCWSEVAGFSKFSSYTGNGGSNSITGLGFKPKYVLMKCSTKATSWMIADSTRGDNQILRAQTTDAETTESISFSFDADGFSFNTSNDNFNESGKTYIYASYAANPANDWTVNNLVGNAVTVQYGENTSTSNFDSSSTSLTYDTTGFTYNTVLSPKTDTGQANASTVLKSADGSSVSWTFSTDSTNRYIWTSSNGINWSSTGNTYPVSSSPQTVTAAWVAWAGGSNSSTLTVTFADSSNTDSMRDSPTNGTQTDTGAGGEVVGNYATLNPLQNACGDTFSDGNLKVVTNTGAYGTHTSTMATPLSGKWYAEVTLDSANNDTCVALVASDSTLTSTSWPGTLNGVVYYGLNGNKYIDTVVSSYGATFGQVAGTVIGIAYDADNGTVIFYKNGVSQGTISSVPIRNYFFGASDYSSSASITCTWNFGQRAFAYTAPSGYKALNTSSLPTPTIADGSQYFDTKLYDGNGNGSNEQTGLNFSPDFAWIKPRNAANSHNLYDTIRGDNKRLVSNAESSEQTVGFEFKSNGFDPTGSNDNGTTYATWAWDAGDDANPTTIAAGSLNSSAYDQSQTWSNGTQSNADTGRPLTNLFDNSTSTLIAASGGSNSNNKVTLSVSITAQSSVRYYSKAGGYNNGPTTLSNSGTTVSTIAAESNQATGWKSFTGTFPMTFNEFTVQRSADAGGTGSGAALLEVDGKILIDSGVSVANVPSIASQVMASPESGFSIVKYTANGTNGATVGHGLNSQPHFMIGRQYSAASGWGVYHNSIGNTGALHLNNSTSTSTSSIWWNNTSPSSSVFTIGTVGAFNTSGEDVIFYCFSPVEGYSAMGSYTGNGSADGPFVYTGFRVGWLLVKLSSAANGNWWIWDSEREPENPITLPLYANTNAAETSSGTGSHDLLSNGFKFRDTGGAYNASGETFIYLAFAENPFKSSRAR